MISIVDYGLGNIKAFANVYKRLNIECTFVSTSSQLKKATKIILPGVGAIDHAMAKLNSSGLRECLDELVLEHKVPVIGICVGMQMMANSSEEGTSKGLGWISGKVKKFKYQNKEQESQYPLPHMGWNNIEPVIKSNLFRGLDEYRKFYFLHSFYFQCENDENIVATANYGNDYACVINKDNIYGIQCHPEKSHHNGVAILNNFANI